MKGKGKCFFIVIKVNRRVIYSCESRLNCANRERKCPSGKIQLLTFVREKWSLRFATYRFIFLIPPPPSRTYNLTQIPQELPCSFPQVRPPSQKTSSESYAATLSDQTSSLPSPWSFTHCPTFSNARAQGT